MNRPQWQSASCGSKNNDSWSEVLDGKKNKNKMWSQSVEEGGQGQASHAGKYEKAKTLPLPRHDGNTIPTVLLTLEWAREKIDWLAIVV